MVEADDLPAKVIEASVDERVVGLLVGLVVDRPIDEYRDLRAEVDEVGAGLRGGDQLLRFIGKPAAFGDEQVDEAVLEGRVAAALEEGCVVIAARGVLGRSRRAGKVQQ